MAGYADFLGFLKMERLILIIAGFYPMKGKKLYKILHSVSAAFFLSISLLYVLLALIFCYLNISDVTVISEIVTFLLSVVAYIGKIINFFYYKKNLRTIENFLRDPILTELETDEEEKILSNNLKYSRFFTNIHKGIAIIATTVHAFLPLIARSESKTFVFLVWFPFNPENYYALVYIYEVLVLMSCAIFDVTFDVLNILMMSLCATNFELLKSQLAGISSKFSDDEVVDDMLRLRKIRKCVIHHNLIYRCTALVEETYSVGAFCQISCSVMIVCFGVFKMLLAPLKSLEFIMMASYSLTMIYKISLYCSYGQKVVNASDSITETCYMSKWYNCSLNVQKYLVMIMNRANQPVVIKAGYIFALTLETLMSVYTSTYSFFTILWQVYNTDE